MNDIEKVFSQARNYVDVKNFKDILIMGDFNFLSIDSSNCGVTAIKKNNCIEEYFCDILNDNFFYQHVNIPTFQKSIDVLVNILDLILTTESGTVAAVETSFILGYLV